MRDARGEVVYVGQGPEPPPPRPELLAEGGVGPARGPPDPRRHRSDRRRRVHDHRLGQRGAAPRGEPHQALPAAVQRPAQGRQELPVHQDHHGRRLPAGRADPQARRRRQPLLRAVRVGEQRRRVDEPGPAALPVPDLHDRHQGRGAGPPAAVPAVPHQALPGPLHRGRLEARLSGPDRRRSSCSSRAARSRSCRALTGEMRAASERTDYEQAAGLRDKIRAIERTMESQKMAAFRRTAARPRRARPAGQPGGDPAVRDPQRVTARPRRLPPRRRPRGARRGGPLELPRAVLRAGDVDPAAGPRPVRLPDGRRISRRSSTARRDGPVRSSFPQRGEKRELMALATQNAARDARARAGALAGRPGQDPRGARGARGGARAARARRCGSSATTSPTSRAPTRSAAWSSSRRASPGRGSTAASEIKTVVGRERLRLHQEVLRRRFRRAPVGRGGLGRGAALGDARPRDHRRRQGPGRARPRRSSTSSGCTTCRSPAWRRSARSCSCPGASDPIVLPPTSQRALHGPAHPRRGPPVRDHLPPRPAVEAPGPLGVRRPAGRRAEAAAGAAPGVRLGEAGPRGAGRADRSGSRDRARRSPRRSRRRWRPEAALVGPAARNVSVGTRVIPSTAPCLRGPDVCHRSGSARSTRTARRRPRASPGGDGCGGAAAAPPAHDQRRHRAPHGRPASVMGAAAGPCRRALRRHGAALPCRSGARRVGPVASAAGIAGGSGPPPGPSRISRSSFRAGSSPGSAGSPSCSAPCSS